MRTLIIAMLGMLLPMAGCGGDNGGSSPGAGEGGPPAATKGGTITVGEETWTLVPAISCFIYPGGGEISIAGHAKENPELEISLDWGGSNSVYVAESDSARGWHAIRETLEVRLDGRRVTGSATFSEYWTGTGDQQQGSFDFQC